MGLSIRNVNKGLQLKIIKCIELLGEEYTSLDFTLYFYDSRERLEKERLNKSDMADESYEQILTGENEAGGITLGEKGKIKIFLFLFGDVKRDRSEMIKLIANIYHELRHAWQYKNNLYKDEPEISKIDGNFEDYLSLPSEKDAFKFQEKVMQELGDQILEILGIKLGENEGYKYQLMDKIREIVYS